MAKQKIPKTPAIRALTQAEVAFEPQPYDSVERGGTRASSEALGVDEHAVIKTLVMQTSDGNPLIVLMHGDSAVSTKALARTLNVKSVDPCTPKDASRHTGYQVGGTSPFGTRKRLPVYVERSVLALPRIWINGGKRGLLVSMNPADLSAVLTLTPVDVAR